MELVAILIQYVISSILSHSNGCKSKHLHDISGTVVQRVHLHHVCVCLDEFLVSLLQQVDFDDILDGFQLRLTNWRVHLDSAVQKGFEQRVCILSLPNQPDRINYGRSNPLRSK